MDKYEEYALRKQDLQNKGLSPAEYENAVKELCKELEI